MSINQLRSGVSSSLGKNTILNWINSYSTSIHSVMDIGVGKGTYYNLLNETISADWDGIEIWKPYIDEFKLEERYNKIYCADARNFDWTQKSYDLTIMGDVIEHMTKEEAIELVNKILEKSKYCIISLPVCWYPQEAFDDNHYEQHIKDDWSHNEMLETFPDIKLAYVDNFIGVYLLSKKVDIPFNDFSDPAVVRKNNGVIDRVNNIKSLYLKILGREADRNGLEYHVHSDKSIQELIQIFLNCDEYKNLIKQEINITNIFSTIYDLDIWKNGSGPGSTIEFTTEYREQLVKFIKENNIKTVLDYGCGDWQFSKLIDWDNLVESYTGVDIVKSVIEYNQQNYQNNVVKFQLIDSNFEFPKVDLVLCKDVLHHLPNKIVRPLIKKMLINSKYSLLTNDYFLNTKPDRGTSNVNGDCDIGTVRPLNFNIGPWFLNGEVLVDKKSDTVPWNHSVLVKSNQNKPLVSIIIPAFKNTYWIIETLSSVLTQSFKDFEIIVVNDGGEPLLDNIMECYEHLPNISYIKHHINKGVSAARNTAIKTAVGKYIIPLDSDDVINDQNWLKDFVEHADDNTIVTAPYTYCDMNMRPLNRIWPNQSLPFQEIVNINILTTSSLFPKKLWEDVGGYDESLKSCEDWDLWVAAYKHGYNLKHLKKPYINYRTNNPDSLSVSEDTKKMIDLVAKKHNLETSYDKMISYKIIL